MSKGGGSSLQAVGDKPHNNGALTVRYTASHSRMAMFRVLRQADPATIAAGVDPTAVNAMAAGIAAALCWIKSRRLLSVELFGSWHSPASLLLLLLLPVS